MTDVSTRPFDLDEAELLAAANKARFKIGFWRAMLGASGAVSAGRRLRLDGRVVISLLPLGAAIVFAVQNDRRNATLFAALWLAVLLLIAFSNTRGRFIIGEFRDSTKRGDEPAVDLAKLLLVEISRLGDLLRVVGDQRAVSSELSHQRALDATLSVDALTDSLQGTVSAESKITVGPISIPLAPFITLLGKVVQAPRLTGKVHRDGCVLILTAQTSGRGGLSWRVQADTDASQTRLSAPVLSSMVRELALRIYTDLTLGRAVRWEATDKFVEGLQRFRSCLRTPKDRKVNLQRAEDLFLDALGEDEEFPLAYYNLGVVYTELHGLAVAAGREEEAKTRLSAAETSFGRAIEKDPTRWECYFAFAQTQFRYSRFDSVVELCRQMLELGASHEDEAKTQELWARALADGRKSGPVDYREALERARRASTLALGCLVRARLWGRSSGDGNQDPQQRAAALASGCLLTFSEIVSRRMPTVRSLPNKRVRSWYQLRIQRRAQALTKLAPLAHGKAELRHKLGRRALEGGYFELAEDELAAAVRSDPTRPAYTAGLALAIATRLREHRGEILGPSRAEIEGLCLRALQAMAGTFFPSRDATACDTVADVYELMNSPADEDPRTAKQLRSVSAAVQRQLAESPGGASVSGAFLEALQSAGIPLAKKVGDYGRAAHGARVHLAKGRRLSGQGKHEAALKQFSDALDDAERARSLNPLSTLAWETLGDVHRELSDFQNARFAWEQALTTDPDNPKLYDKIGSSYWQIADDGRTGSGRDELEIAARHFDDALILYPKGSFDGRILTHHRLGKLHASLRNFTEAERHLEIVAAVGTTPIVGWQLLAFAYLERRNFTDAEHYFSKVVEAGETLALHHSPDAIVGDRLDEQRWPLNLIRCWGNIGLAISYIERDGSLPAAQRHVERADTLLEQLHIDRTDPARDARFPTRAPAAIMECRGLIHLRRREVDEAACKLQRAVSCFPHSRSYYGLALALEEQAIHDEEARRELVERARRLLGHARCLRPAGQRSEELDKTEERLSRLANVGLMLAA